MLTVCLDVFTVFTLMCLQCVPTSSRCSRCVLMCSQCYLDVFTVCSNFVEMLTVCLDVFTVFTLMCSQCVAERKAVPVAVGCCSEDSHRPPSPPPSSSSSRLLYFPDHGSPRWTTATMTSGDGEWHSLACGECVLCGCGDKRLVAEHSPLVSGHSPRSASQ